MKALILPPALLPPVSYMAALISGEEVYIEKYGHFIRQSVRNRFYIASANGVLLLSAELEHGRKNHIPYAGVMISDRRSWQKHRLRSIESAYARSPYYQYYREEFENAFCRSGISLNEYSSGLLQCVASLMKIEPGHTETLGWMADYPDCTDLRSSDTFFPECPQPPYTQVFSDRYGFIPGLSILDLLFCKGPESALYLKQYASLIAAARE